MKSLKDWLALVMSIAALAAVVINPIWAAAQESGDQKVDHATLKDLSSKVDKLLIDVAEINGYLKAKKEGSDK